MASGFLASIYLMLATSFAVYGVRFYGVVSRISQASLLTRIVRFDDVVFKVREARHVGHVRWPDAQDADTTGPARAATRASDP